jgi:hypothetical protein
MFDRDLTGFLVPMAITEKEVMLVIQDSMGCLV